jgi:MoxR-like ATPase
MSETLTKRIATILEKLQYGLEGLDKAIRLALLAALTGEHLLLYGPPGSGKTLVARRLRQAFSNALYFEPPLTQFTVPLIEYLSFLSQGRVNSPHWIVMFDKILEADWPIRGALLQLLRDSQNRQFEIEFEIPWMTVIGTSSTRPESEEHKALLDRFLLSYPMYPVRQDKVRSPLTLIDSDPSIPDELKFSSKDLEEIRKESATVTVPEGLLHWLSTLREKDFFPPPLFGPNRDNDVNPRLFVSDRRRRRIVKLLQTSAWTNGRRDVSIADCWLLTYCTVPQNFSLWSRYLELTYVTESDIQAFEGALRDYESIEARVGDDLDHKASVSASIRATHSQIESYLSDTLKKVERWKACRDQADRDCPAQLWDDLFVTIARGLDSSIKETMERIQRLEAIRDRFNKLLDKLLAEQPS